MKLLVILIVSLVTIQAVFVKRGLENAQECVDLVIGACSKHYSKKDYTDFSQIGEYCTKITEAMKCILDQASSCSGVSEADIRGMSHFQSLKTTLGTLAQWHVQECQMGLESIDA